MNQEQQQALLNFARDILFYRYDILDQCDIQDLAIKYGLMSFEIKTFRCDDYCECDKYLFGDEKEWKCYRIAEWLRSENV